MSTPTDPQTLLTQAKCYMCLGVSLAEALQLALLADIVTNGSTGGGSGSGVVIGAGVPQPNTFGVHNNTTGKPILVVVSVLLVTTDGGTPAQINVTDNAGNVYPLEFTWNAGISLNDQLLIQTQISIPVPVGGHYTLTNVSDFQGQNALTSNVIYTLT